MADESEAARSEVADRREQEVEFNRIVAFSDGVFAIAITLLVLALDVPERAEDLAHSLTDQEDDFFAYALSFAVLGNLWLSHHRFFGTLERFDGRLMGINLFYLAWVALVPFSSEVLGDYSSQSDAVIVYALNMIGVSLAFAWQLLHADRHGLIKQRYLESDRREAAPMNLAVAAIFAISIPIALIDPTTATLSWLAIFVLGRVRAFRRSRRDSPQPG